MIEEKSTTIHRSLTVLYESRYVIALGLEDGEVEIIDKKEPKKVNAPVVRALVKTFVDLGISKLSRVTADVTNFEYEDVMMDTFGVQTLSEEARIRIGYSHSNKEWYLYQHAHIK